LAGDWFPKRTIGSLVDERLARDGRRQALIFEDRRWTFAELARDVDAVARGLVALGIAPGDKVSLWMMNRPEWICTALAVMRIGAVLVPINTRFRTEDAAYVLGQSDSSTLVIAARSGPTDYLDMVRTMLPTLGSGGDAVSRSKAASLAAGDRAGRRYGAGDDRLVVAPGGGLHVSNDAFAARIEAVDPNATAFIIYTSGTTGFPKGVMHSHIMIRNVVERAFRMGITPADTILMYLPLYHLFGFSEGMLMSLATGARQILTETFDPNESLRLLEMEQATILHGFDTHFKDLLQAYRQRPRDTASVRTGILATGCRARCQSRCSASLGHLLPAMA
jgi:fatty-acyl-CoA synthase